jgi:outer membrane protein assembly factor BamE (lipoprotein component of BamABCDE complex)
MKILILIFFFILSNCTLNKVNKHHGVHFLKKKNESLIVKKTNKNDIIKLLGQPSTESKFDNDLWIYIEREITRGRLLNLGKNILIKNNVLILEIDNRGILLSKKFNNMDDMKEIQFSEDETTQISKKNDFIYSFLSSLRQKINDPLGKRKK